MRARIPTALPRRGPGLCLSAAPWMLALLLGCEEPEEPEVELSVGPGKPFQFHPKTALARYFELVGQPDQLHVIVASYDTSCDEYESPPAGEAYVTVVVRVPTGQTIEPGTFEWKGDIDAVAEAKEPSALPFVRLESEGRPLPGGGTLVIESLQRTLYGQVVGEFRFTSGNDDSGSLAALRGPFSARVCEVVRDPSRTQNEEE